jgi:hypothetical protein
MGLDRSPMTISLIGPPLFPAPPPVAAVDLPESSLLQAVKAATVAAAMPIAAIVDNRFNCALLCVTPLRKPVCRFRWRRWRDQPLNARH